MMRRRQLLVGAGLLAGTSACAEKWGFSSGGNGKVQLTYALWDAYQQVGYRKSIDLFQRRNPHIEVTIDQIPYGSYQSKITAEYISGNAPDVFWVNTPFLGDWIENGLVADLTGRVRSAGIDLEQYFPALVALHQRNGRTYGLPKDWDTIALYYNKDHFAKRRVEPRNDLTWAPDGSGTYLPFLQRLTVDSHGNDATSSRFDAGSVTTYATAIANDFQSGWGNYIAMLGGTLLIDRPFATTSSLTSTANREALEYVTSTLREAHVVAPAGEIGPNADGSSMQQLFSQGRIAIYQAGDWNTSALAQLTAFRIGVMELPHGPKGQVTVFNGLCDGMSGKTKHPEEAWQLVKWLASADSQRIMGGGGYVWPAIRSLDPLFLAYWKKSKNIDLSAFLTEATGKTVNFPVGTGVGEALTDVGTELGPVFLGTRSPASGLSSAAAVADHRLSAN